ncbi:hypothetical protein MNEG_0662 [Monoraphidium neglectum]|uniref:SAP domain-containing protein n=1 Tax=Monoraphidium neglectum TaxID=145388 RepID=A0A0D2NSU2_9CHLO|nr:hypothetical protein MNEG_0662 [Monoraphidium neglectum]KIZ07286.1 hypothetical protein MNEG_0662 [Monoraphidium neglectum]|eukprot:XP_013906305.1 hypothetical protein MNEG_0662 [Monoraphidium neglectum]
MPKVELDDLALRHGVAKRGTKAEVVDRLLGDLLDQASALGPSAPGVLDAAPAADVKQRRQRRTSRKATASADPLPEPAPAATTAAPPTEAPARRARRTSRRVSAVVEESAPAAPATSTAALGPAEAAPDAPVTPAKRARRQSRKTAAIEPEPAAVAAVEEAVAPKQRARRSSRKSAAMDPADGAAAPAPAPARQRSRGRSPTVSAADGADVAMSESALGRQSKAWLQQAVAERGVYDPALHTTKAALVAALLGASTAARPEVPTTPLAIGEGLVLGEEEASVNEEPYLDATPAFCASYEEVLSQVRGGAGLEDEPAISGDAFGPAAAGAMASAAELLRVGAEVDDAASVRAAAEVERETLKALSARVASRDEARLAAEEEGVGGFADEGAAAALYRAAPDLEDIAAALAEGGGAGGALAEDEAEDAALGVFDHLAFHFEADAAPVAAPDLEDIAAALAEGGGAGDASAAEDEAEDAALGVFDHLAFDFEADLDAAAAEAEVEAAPDAGEAALAAAATAAEADAALLLRSTSPLLVQDGAALVDEEPDGALRAFDHIAFDFDLQRASAAQFARAAEPPLLAPSAAAALAEAAPIVLQDEAPDVALASFDHAHFTPPRAAAEAEAPAAVAAPRSADLGAPVGGAQRQQQQADVLVQFGEWLKEVVAAFEEWQRSLGK